MKHIKKYKKEKLHVTTKSHLYSCQPKTKDELQKIIIKRIQDVGPECDLNDIDVSKITDMYGLFYVNDNEIFKDFNGDISRWDVSHVKNMTGMFYLCEQFNCDISDWDVSNVENMNYTFYTCTKFRQNLDKWNVKNVGNMLYAFNNCPTQPKWYNKDLWEY